MDLSLSSQLNTTPDLSRRLRRLHFFDTHFRNHVTTLAARNGLSITVDTVRLTEAFLSWGETFARQRAAAEVNRRDYAIFSAGLLLSHLIQIAPVSVSAARRSARTAETPSSIVAFWPEGFLYTGYCVNALDALLRQESGRGITPTAKLDDLRVWQSFRENAREDPTSVVGFFDLFVGCTPNWHWPTIAMMRPGMTPAARPAELAAPAG